MKGKPVFKNVTKGRIQIIRQGIPIWLDSGDVIVGEKYRAFLSLGLKEVGKEGLPKRANAPVVITQVVNDEEPEKSPIKVRKINLQDTVIPIDVVKVAVDPGTALPALPPAEGETPEVSEDPVEPAGEPELLSEGEALKSDILAELEAEWAAEEAEEEHQVDDDDIPVVLLEDDEAEELDEEDTHPFKCNECDKSFASKRGLKSHNRMHDK